MFTAPFPELASESLTISLAEIDPTRFWDVESVDGVPVWPAAARVTEGVVSERMVLHRAGERVS